MFLLFQFSSHWNMKKGKKKMMETISISGKNEDKFHDGNFDSYEVVSYIIFPQTKWIERSTQTHAKVNYSKTVETKQKIIIYINSQNNKNLLILKVGRTNNEMSGRSILEEFMLVIQMSKLYKKTFGDQFLSNHQVYNNNNMLNILIAVK